MKKIANLLVCMALVTCTLSEAFAGDALCEKLKPDRRVRCNCAAESGVTLVADGNHVHWTFGRHHQSSPSYISYLNCISAKHVSDAPE